MVDDSLRPPTSVATVPFVFRQRAASAHLRAWIFDTVSMILRASRIEKRLRSDQVIIVVVTMLTVSLGIPIRSLTSAITSATLVGDSDSIGWLRGRGRCASEDFY